MGTTTWLGTTALLAERTAAADRAKARVEAAKDRMVRSGPTEPDDPSADEKAEYQHQLSVYVHTKTYLDVQAEVFAAVALSKARDAAVLRAASLALQRRAADSRPPRSLPKAFVLPGEATPQWWMNLINKTDAGIWRSIPRPGAELRIGSPDNPLVQDVAQQARLLQASLTGHRSHGSYYEAYHPDPQRPCQGPTATPIPGLSPDLSRRLRLRFGTGGMRVTATRDDEFRQASRDSHAVWTRARSYGSAVLALIRDTA